jgi:hypothetical protein
MSKDTIKMRYSYEQCTTKDKLHDNELIYKDGEPDYWLCKICGRRAGLMRPA